MIPNASKIVASINALTLPLNVYNSQLRIVHDARYTKRDSSEGDSEGQSLHVGDRTAVNLSKRSRLACIRLTRI